MTVGYVDVCEAYKYHNLNSPSIGDRVKIFDKSMNTKTLQRIITTKIYPFEPRKSTIEVGHPQVTIDSFFKDIATSNIIQKIQRNGKKEIKTSYLEMMRENVKVSINEALQNENIAKYQTGALFESPDGKVPSQLSKVSWLLPDRKQMVNGIGQQLSMTMKLSYRKYLRVRCIQIYVQ